MKNLRERLERVLPRYAWFPLAVTFLLNSAVYWGTMLLVRDERRVNIAIALDAKLPFVPAAIIVYVLAYASWVINYVLIARESREAAYRVFVGNWLSKLLCLAVFVLMPTGKELPDASGAGFWLWAVRLIYSLDKPVNLFPSIHCLESWIGWRGMAGCRSIPGWCKACSLVMAVLVFASTVLVKQHYIVDIPSGMLAAEVGLAASGWLLRARKRRSGT